MNTELRAMLTGRGVELPGENEIDRLCELEGRWRALDERRALVTPWRVAEAQKAAHEAFLADPSVENEMQIAVLADTAQTALRYAARHWALTAAMGLLAREAADMLAPFFTNACVALQEEMELRRENKTTDYAQSDPAVKQCRDWMTDADRAGIRASCSHQGDHSPMELAEFFVTRPEEDGK